MHGKAWDCHGVLEHKQEFMTHALMRLLTTLTKLSFGGWSTGCRASNHAEKSAEIPAHNGSIFDCRVALSSSAVTHAEMACSLPMLCCARAMRHGKHGEALVVIAHFATKVQAGSVSPDAYHCPVAGAETGDDDAAVPVPNSGRILCQPAFLC
jgi:hypothetical protein